MTSDTEIYTNIQQNITQSENKQWFRCIQNKTHEN